jgi:hypothetical protein
LLHFLARLACVKRAASVDSEPGSNSRLICLSLTPHIPTPLLQSENARLLAPAVTQILTNYFFFTSNQIVNHLRNSTHQSQINPSRNQSVNDQSAARPRKAVSVYRPQLSGPAVPEKCRRLTPPIYLIGRLPTLPHTCACSTIGAERLNFRVRDGNGWGPLARITRSWGPGLVYLGN